MRSKVDTIGWSEKIRHNKRNAGIANGLDCLLQLHVRNSYVHAGK